MSETPPEAPPATPPAPAQEPKEKPETDWKAEARKHELRAKEYKVAADKLAAIEAASKSDAEKAADRLAAAEKDAADARSEALRYKIAAQYQISGDDAELFLTGTDEATMTAQAKRLTDREAERKKHGNYVPREGTNPKPGSDSDREVVRALFQG